MKNNMLRKNPLFDKEFLKELFSFQHREVYAKIILLNMREEPLEMIEGKITDGSINVDGSSAVRRTCNLTMVAEDVNINEFYWGLQNKFKLEVGLKNFINNSYPEVIWFPQGIYVFTQFNTSQTTNSWSIKIQGKDKMCLLNGEVSGQLPPTDFATEQYEDLETGEITLTKIPIKTIISRLLQEFALELPHNIIINDIDEAGYDLLEYRGNEPFYLIKNVITGEIDNMSVKPLECYYQLKQTLTLEEYNKIPDIYSKLRKMYQKDNLNVYHFSKDVDDETIDWYDARIKDTDWFQGTLEDNFNITYDDLLDDEEFEGGTESTKIRFAKNGVLQSSLYSIIKIEYGDIPGYRATELVFAGELKSSAGETITSVLDKIKNKFTNFEYYYDLNGKFVFQKKKYYLSTPWNSGETEGDSLYNNAGINNEEILFTFSDGVLITSVSNTPKLQDLKNDYSVHGARDNLALRMRYAIDTKPTEYIPIRPLKEKIVTIKRDSNNHIIDEQIEYKYYDAPEIEPYNESGLIALDQSYKIIETLDKKVNNIKNPQTSFNIYDYAKISEALEIAFAGTENYNWAFSLFEMDDQLNYIWKGNHDNLTRLIELATFNKSYCGVFPQMSKIITDDGYEIWKIIYPYFAKYPYSTQHVVLTNKEEIQYKDIIESGDNVIHYKVDWRELIYQMSKDYRQLNTSDNYYYYLGEMNPFVSYNKTGYEQYYIDIISNWRDLYDPNPKIQFDSSIKYNEIKRQSLLLDDSEDNDNEDMIYIKGSYSLIKPDADKSVLNYSNVYQLSAPEEAHIKSLYPFYKSKGQCLNERESYYLENETNQKIQQINDAVYETLKNISPNRIYIKENDEYILAAEKTFETALNNSLASNSITGSTTFPNTKYFIVNPDYVKLTKEDPLWDLYYRSDFYPIAFKTSEILNELEELSKTVKSYSSKPISFIDTFNNIFKKYCLYLEHYDYSDIHNCVLQTIKPLYNSYRSDIETLFNPEDSYGNQKFSQSLSCLPDLYEILQSDYEKISQLDTNKTPIEQLTDIIKLINNLNVTLQKTLRNLELNYNQMSFILKDTALNNYLSLDASQLSNEEKISAIDSIKTQLENHKQILDELKTIYTDGQSAKTKTQLEEIITDIGNNKLSYNSVINRVTTRIKQPIEEIDNQWKAIRSLTLSKFLWIPINAETLEDLEEADFQTAKESHTIYTLCIFLKNLVNIFQKNSSGNYVNSANQIKNLLTRNNYKLFRTFQNSLTGTIKSVVSDFEESTKDFQEYIVLEDTNNFNIIESNKVYYIAINYNKGYYNYNRAAADGNYWYKGIFESPQLLTFWFDFLEPSTSDISKYAVTTVGIRSKVINDKDVKSVHYKDIPQVIFIDPDKDLEGNMSGYARINLTKGFMNLFAISTKGKTAKERIDELLSSHSYCIESINLSTIPVYNLEPNNKIYIEDGKCNIRGEYYINKITIPLSFKKTMSITATKSVNSIV